MVGQRERGTAVVLLQEQRRSFGWSGHCGCGLIHDLHYLHIHWDQLLRSHLTSHQPSHLPSHLNHHDLRDQEDRASSQPSPPRRTPRRSASNKSESNRTNLFVNALATYFVSFYSKNKKKQSFKRYKRTKTLMMSLIQLLVLYSAK